MHKDTFSELKRGDRLNILLFPGHSVVLFHILNQVQETQIKGSLLAASGMRKMFFNILVSFIDVDECSVKPGICGTAVCKNFPGDFECECAEGYRYNPTSKSCEGRVVMVSLLVVERVGLNPDLILEALVLFDINNQIF